GRADVRAGDDLRRAALAVQVRREGETAPAVSLAHQGGSWSSPSVALGEPHSPERSKPRILSSPRKAGGAGREESITTSTSLALSPSFFAEPLLPARARDLGSKADPSQGGITCVGSLYGHHPGL